LPHRNEKLIPLNKKRDQCNSIRIFDEDKVMQSHNPIEHIEDGKLLAGKFPNNKTRLVQAWIEIRREELNAAVGSQWGRSLQDRSIEIGERMNPYVKSVKPLDDYCLLLTFENSEKRIFDLKPYLNKGVFARLQNVALFKTVRVVSGSVEWRGEIDLSYDTLYLESKPVKTGMVQHKTTTRKRNWQPFLPNA
jgi:hypothetical protein